MDDSTGAEDAESGRAKRVAMTDRNSRKSKAPIAAPSVRPTTDLPGKTRKTCRTRKPRARDHIDAICFTDSMLRAEVDVRLTRRPDES